MSLWLFTPRYVQFIGGAVSGRIINVKTSSPRYQNNDGCFDERADGQQCRKQQINLGEQQWLTVL